MIAAAIGLLAGAIAAQSNNLDVDVGIVIVLVGGVALATDYSRSLRDQG